MGDRKREMWKKERRRERDEREMRDRGREMWREGERESKKWGRKRRER